MHGVLFVCLAVLVAAIRLEAGMPLPPEIKNAVSFGFPWVAAGFDGAGNLYVASSVDFTGPLPPTATLIGSPCSAMPSAGAELDEGCLMVAKVSAGQLVHVTVIGGVAGMPAGLHFAFDPAMYVDPIGDVFLAGGLTNAAYPTAPWTGPAAPGAYLLKLDPSGTKVLYATFIGSIPDRTQVQAIAVAPDGSIYVAGSTSDPKFPTTPGALQPSSSVGPGSYTAFVTKFSPAGKLVASTFFGFGPQGGQTDTMSMAVDSSGVVHIAGGVSTITTTPGFVARLNSSLTELLYSTMIPDTPNSIQVSTAGDDYVAGGMLTKIAVTGNILYQTPLAFGAFDLLLLKDGSIAVGGITEGVSFPTKDTLEPCQRDRGQTYVNFSYPPSAVFALLNSEGQVTFATYLGGTDGSQIISVIQDASGSLYLAGWANGTDFPGSPLLAGGQWGYSTFVFELDLSGIPQGAPFPACLLTSDGGWPAAPGMISTLYGDNLGPSAGVSFQLDQNGEVPTQLAGISVSVGGFAAPVLYAQEGQINFIVPQELTGEATSICVASGAGRNCIYPPVQPLFPYIFNTEGTGYAILNQDGTLNTPANPAPRRSYISLFGTGMGTYDRSFPDGSVVGPPLAYLAATVTAVFPAPTPPPPPCGEMFLPPCPPPNTTNGKVLFAGAAPGEVAGVTQINLEIPDNAISGPEVGLTLIFGQEFYGYAVLAIE